MTGDPPLVAFCVGAASPLVVRVRADEAALLRQVQQLWRPYVVPGSLLAILVDLVFVLIVSVDHRARAGSEPLR